MPAASRRLLFRFLFSSSVGVAFFLCPLPWGGRFTVPFDILVSLIVGNVPHAVAVYCLLVIVFGAAASALARFQTVRWRRLESYRTSTPLLLLRLIGAPLAILYMCRIGPAALMQDEVAALMWNTLAFSVGIIIPVGAAFLGLFVRYGFLEFVGTLMRPIMRPLFRLPGRAALDSITSWVGSYSVGLYLTRRLTVDGFYSKREAYTIATCFSTVSMGFVGVVAATLQLLHLFPLIFATYFVCIYMLTFVLVRIWPITSVSEAYLVPARLEADEVDAPGTMLRRAWQAATRQAEAAPALLRTIGEGLLDGLMLASTILGSILVVGTVALLVARETQLFGILGQPLAPLLRLLGIPDAELVGPAVLVGITEMYIPALLVQEAALPARFFICVLSISQLIFFSSVAPMILDMFREIPVRARDLIALFVIRTALLVPILAALTAVLVWGGVL
jgi:nucleoside recognition membrane protein YjiH